MCRTSGASAAKAPTSCSRGRPASVRLRRLQGLVRLYLTHEGIAFRVSERFDRQIDIEVRPVQMLPTGQLHAAYFCNRSILEPGEFLERHKELFLADEQPESVGRDVRYLNPGRASPRRCGFHSDAPQPVSRLLHSASVEPVVHVEFNRRFDPEFASPSACWTCTCARRSSREKKSNRNPRARKTVGLTRTSIARPIRAAHVRLQSRNRQTGYTCRLVPTAMNRSA